MFAYTHTHTHAHTHKVLKLLPSAVGVLVTAGEGGCAYAFSKLGGAMPAFEVPVVDTTGAGDAFTAGCDHMYISVHLSICRCRYIYV